MRVVISRRIFNYDWLCSGVLKWFQYDATRGTWRWQKFFWGVKSQRAGNKVFGNLKTMGWTCQEPPRAVAKTNKKKRKKETRDVCIRLERKWNRKNPFEMASCRVGCESNCRNPLNLWLCNSHSTCCFFGFRLAFLDAITYDIFVPPAPIDVIVFGGIVNKRHMIFLRLRQVNNDIRQKTSKFQSVDGKT